MTDAKVIPLWNDRRVAPSTAPQVQPYPTTRAEFYDHISTMHGRGIAKARNLDVYHHVHSQLHANDGLTFTHETQHVHG